MKTHDLAKALANLSKLLRSGPNVELDQLRLDFGQPQPAPRSDAAKSQQEERVNLLTLVALAGQPKKHWVRIIEEYKLPVTIRSRDSAREIMWNVVSYLAHNELARAQLKEDGKKTKASPVLMSALQSLLDV